jgi:hypothetical protein
VESLWDEVLPEKQTLAREEKRLHARLRATSTTVRCSPPPKTKTQRRSPKNSYFPYATTALQGRYPGEVARRLWSPDDSGLISGALPIGEATRRPSVDFSTKEAAMEPTIALTADQIGPLMAEIRRYLDVVETFRRLGCEPRWRAAWPAAVEPASGAGDKR